MQDQHGREGGRVRPPYSAIPFRAGGDDISLWKVALDGVPLPETPGIGEKSARENAALLNEAWERGFEAGKETERRP